MKTLILTMAIALSSLTFIPNAAPAAPLTPEEQAGLSARITSFSQAFDAGDLSKVGEVIPPKILAIMSDQFGLSPAELLDAMASAMEQTMQNVTIDSYAMDQAGATLAETSTGRTYLLIPTQTVMTVQGTTQIQSNNQTLAFADEGAWYLVRIDEAQQVQFLTQAYPDFAGIDFPAGTTKILNE